MINGMIVRAVVERLATDMEHDAEMLNEADGRLGDGDLGVTVSRGWRAASESLQTSHEEDLGKMLGLIAQAFTRVSGSSFGTLLAVGLLRAGKMVSGKTAISASQIPELLDVACRGMQERGKASIGDKTVLDSIETVRLALLDAPSDTHPARHARDAARVALTQYRDRPNRVGRARMFAEQSIGIDDPGMLAFAQMTRKPDSTDVTHDFHSYLNTRMTMNTAIRDSLRQSLTGILPPVTMPFGNDGELLPEKIKEQIDFIIRCGAHGIVAGGSTGEGHTLDSGDFVTAMEATHAAIDRRVPFLVGLIVNSTRDAINRVKALEGLHIDALQVTPVHYLFKPDADATVNHFRAIWDATGVPILIYNVIPWNYLSAELMLRIMEEVPGVIGMKQSSGDLKSLSDLLLRAKPNNLILTGIDALLYPAFTLGAHGAISALCSGVPAHTVRLFESVKANHHADALELHRQLGTLWDSIRHDNLPACIKYIQSRHGLGLYQPRSPMERVSDVQKKAIDAALKPFLS